MAIPPVRSQGDSGHIQDHNDIGTELAARLPLSGGTLTGALNGTSATFTGAVSGASGSFTGTVTAATPTANGHLATKQYVDTAVGSAGEIPFAMYTIGVSVTGLSMAPSDSISIFTNINFPAGRFTVAPHVMVTNREDAGAGGSYKIIYTPTATASTCTVYMANANTSTTITKASAVIQAVQMTSGSATG